MNRTNFFDNNCDNSSSSNNSNSQRRHHNNNSSSRSNMAALNSSLTPTSRGSLPLNATLSKRLIFALEAVTGPYGGPTLLVSGN
ncbi:hypothetical protein EV356DRAFT_538339 [Viridothelium virens]|uniref:Uncharacterized protein n=1 Tax=Viridothelium virens TaxID=1048519 RepID=A0A6A6GRY8_VIRVR|nr:hypothetical protein EV356DRAFT_538339 [Viridothelium virens]